MQEGGGEKRRGRKRSAGTEYPRNIAEVSLYNRFAALGYCIVAYSVYREMSSPEGFDKFSWPIFLTGISLLANTEFGMGTVKAYKRTIDAYRRLGKMSSRYEGPLAGWYCQERGFQLAVKDIEAGKVSRY
jgi:hypothetical protein